MTDVSMELHNQMGLDALEAEGTGAFQMEDVSFLRRVLVSPFPFFLDRFLTSSSLSSLHSQPPIDQAEYIPQGDDAHIEDKDLVASPPSSPNKESTAPVISSPLTGSHVRRKSTLPLDPQVLRDLQNHRSLE